MFLLNVLSKYDHATYFSTIVTPRKVETMRHFILLVLLPLAACVTPQALCIANAGKDIRVLSGLIASTEGNIARGYGIRTEDYFENERQVCGMVNGDDIYCDVAVANTRNVPFAVDLNTEAAKLASLLSKRQELIQSSDAVISECKALYPEA